MRRLVALVMRRNIGLLLIAVLIAILAVSILSNDCLCAETGECFCVEQADQKLHDVSAADLQQIPEPARSRYEGFLRAWEEEYRAKLLAWGRLYTAFHSQQQSEEEKGNFDHQLAFAHRDFLRLFRSRNELFRLREGF